MRLTKVLRFRRNRQTVMLRMVGPILLLLSELPVLAEAYGRRAPRVNGLPIYVRMPDATYQPSHYDPRRPEDSDEACELFFHDYFLTLNEYFWLVSFDSQRWPVESARARKPLRRKTCWFYCRLTLPQRYRDLSGPKRFLPVPDPWSQVQISMKARGRDEEIVLRSTFAYRNIGGNQLSRQSKKCYRARAVQRVQMTLEKGLSDCLESSPASTEVRRIEVHAQRSDDHTTSSTEALPLERSELRFDSLSIIRDDTQVQPVPIHQSVSRSLEVMLQISAGERVMVCVSAVTEPRLIVIMTLWSQ